MQKQIPTVGALNVYYEAQNWSVEQARYWAKRLIQRAALPDQVAFRAFIIEQTGLKPGEKVLELGCGTGRLLSDLAAVTGHSGHVFGLEPQPEFAKAAEQHISDKKLGATAEVISGQAEDIPLADASIDVCVAQTVLIHIPVEILPKVFSEVKRVLKPGGRFVSVDQDIDTWIIDHPQRALTRKIIHFNSDNRSADGWTGRHLKRLFKQNGFTDIRVKTWTQTDTERESYLYEMAQRSALAATLNSIISQEECTDWLKELDKLAGDGDFFSSICYFCCGGTKPV